MVEEKQDLSCVVSSNQCSAVQENAPCFAFHTSDNPFAYMRDEMDVNLFIEAIKRISKGAECQFPLKRWHLELMWIVAKFLVVYCPLGEGSVENLIKLLEQEVSLEGRSLGDISPLGLLVGVTEDADLQQKYDYFVCLVYGSGSNVCKKVVRQCVDFLRATEPKEIAQQLVARNPLRYSCYPRQGELSHGGKTREVWFVAGDTYSVQRVALKRERTENLIRIVLPEFLYQASNRGILEMIATKPRFSLQEFLQDNAEKIWQAIERGTVPYNPTMKKKNEDEDEDTLFSGVDSRTGQWKRLSLYYEYSTAVHEAGHIVAGHILGVRYEGASIVPLNGAAGRAYVLPAQDAFEDAVISYAGYAAEQKYLGSKLSPFCGVPRDFWDATECIKKKVVSECREKDNLHSYFFVDSDVLGLPDDESPVVVFETIRRCAEAQQRAETLVAENMALIEALAQKLYAEKTIAGEVVKEFLDKLQDNEQ